jgi:predicted MFS family arabinose efflux permease
MTETEYRRATFAGLSASLVGIGLARFAYTPLVPSLIQMRWFSAQDVIYLSAANLVGYLAGAMGGRALAKRFGARGTLQSMMLLTSLTFFACAFPLSVGWFFSWRLLSGFAGGAIMVLAAMTILPRVPAERRGIASGAIFLGLGIGIAGSGTLVPLLLKLGLRETWIGLGMLAGGLTAASWAGWPRPQHPGPASAPAAGANMAGALASTPMRKRVLRTIFLQYALTAVGLVPAMLFLVDYSVRGLGFDTAAGARSWISYGIGAMAGPVLYGRLSDRFGAGRTNVATALVQLVALASLCTVQGEAALLIASAVVGTFPPGIVPVYLGAIRETLPDDAAAQGQAWSRATIVFALAQTVTAYGSSWLLNASGGKHAILFMMSAGGLLAAVFLESLRWRLLSKQ